VLSKRATIGATTPQPESQKKFKKKKNAALKEGMRASQGEKQAFWKLIKQFFQLRGREGQLQGNAQKA